jgi:hypothetical protein
VVDGGGECQQIRENSCILQLLKRVVKQHNRTSQDDDDDDDGDDDDDCIRGLESKLPTKIAKKRKRAKHAARRWLSSRSSQHDHQNIECYHYDDVHEIASVYHEACRGTREQAIHPAQQDANNV